MNAPLVPQIDRAILADLSAFPGTNAAAVKNAIDTLADWSYMDYVIEIDLTTAQVIKSVQTEPGYFFLCTAVSVQHDNPTNPPLVQIQDKKKQKYFFNSAVSASAVFGPGAAEPLSEGAAIYWPFGQMANIEVTATKPTGAANTKIVVLVSGWKFTAKGS